MSNALVTVFINLC